MGGIDGLKGYYYQSLAVMLDEFNNNNWLSMEFEADTKEDKVDILWQFENKVKTVQVKSSKNNFSINDINKWLTELIEDTDREFSSDYDEIDYSIILIGPLNNDTTVWCNKINEGTIKISDISKNEFKIIYSRIERINVKICSHNIEDLKARCIVSLIDYIDGRYLNPGKSVLEQIVSSIITDIIESGLKRTSYTPSRLERKIEKMLKHYSVVPIDSLLSKSKLSLKFYEKGILEGTAKMSDVPLDIISFTKEFEMVAEAKLKEAISLNIENDQYILDSESITEWVENFFNERRVGLDNLEKEILLEIDTVKNIKLEEEDFQLGNLTIRDDIFEKVILGDEKSKKKYNLFQDVMYNLLQIKFQKDYLKNYQEVYKMPLIIENEGNKNDEDIRILIEFPPGVEIIGPETIPLPNEILYDEFIDNNMFLKLITPIKDFQLEEFISSAEYRFYKMEDAYLLGIYRKKYSADDFYKYCNSCFKFKVNLNGETTYVEYNLKSIRPGSKIMFPTYLLFRTNLCDFKLKYYLL